MAAKNVGLEIEQQGRIDLAAAFRWTARLNMHEGIANHFTWAVNEDRTEFLVNPWGAHFSEVKASDLLKVGTEGSVLSGKGIVERSAVCIHAPMHKNLSHARCVLHCHPKYVNTLMAIGGRLEPIHQNAARFYGRIAYDDDFNGLAFDDKEGERLCGVLAGKTILMMRNHGVTVLGKTIAEAFDHLYYVEKACETQVFAMWTGSDLKAMKSEIAELTAAQWADHGKFGVDLETDHFAALKRILDREEPDYSQ